MATTWPRGPPQTGYRKQSHRSRMRPQRRIPQDWPTPTTSECTHCGDTSPNPATLARHPTGWQPPAVSQWTSSKRLCGLQPRSGFTLKRICARPLCRRCMGPRGRQGIREPVYCYLPAHLTVCHRHRRWVGPLANFRRPTRSAGSSSGTSGRPNSLAPGESVRRTRSSRWHSATRATCSSIGLMLSGANGHDSARWTTRTYRPIPKESDLDRRDLAHRSTADRTSQRLSIIRLDPTDRPYQRTHHRHHNDGTPVEQWIQTDGRRDKVSGGRARAAPLIRVLQKHRRADSLPSMSTTVLTSSKDNMPVARPRTR